MINTIQTTAIGNTAVAVVIDPTFIPEMFDSFTVSRSAKHEITSKRLSLRPVSKSDLINFVELFSDSAVMKFIGIEAGYIPSYKEIQQLHQSALQAWKTRGYGRWSMFDQKSCEFVGFCGFRSEKGVPELICAMHEKFWERGLAAEAARECLRYGIEEFGFTEVKAFTRPDHTRARKVLDKIGAEFTGYVDFHGVEGAAYRLLTEIS